MDTNTIVKIIKSGYDKDGKYIIELYNQTIGLLYYLTKGFDFKEFEDIKQEFFIWLSDAVYSFEETEETTFTSFLTARLKGNILNYYNSKNIVYIPRNRASFLKRYENQKNKLSNILGKEPTDKQICSFMGISEKELNQIKKDLICVGSIASLDKETKDGAPLADFIEDKNSFEEEITSRIDRERAYKELWHCVCDKSGLSKESIKQYYSDEYKGNKEVLRPHIYKAIKEIRRSPKIMQKIQCDDFNYNKRKSVKSFQNDGFSIVEDIVFKKMERENY